MDQDKDSNPFRPSGVLAQEANEIVNLIKQGKPISPAASPVLKAKEPQPTETAADQAGDGSESKKKEKKKLKKDKNAKEVEVNKSVITDKEASFAEHVTLPEEEKKKKNSSCCAIQ